MSDDGRTFDSHEWFRWRGRHLAAHPDHQLAAAVGCDTCGERVGDYSDEEMRLEDDLAELEEEIYLARAHLNDLIEEHTATGYRLMRLQNERGDD